MNGWSDKFLTGKNMENIFWRVDNMLEYFSEFLLYTDMYMCIIRGYPRLVEYCDRYTWTMQKTGQIRRDGADNRTNGRVRGICAPQRLAKRKIQERAISIP